MWAEQGLFWDGQPLVLPREASFIIWLPGLGAPVPVVAFESDLGVGLEHILLGAVLHGPCGFCVCRGPLLSLPGDTGVMPENPT